MCGYALEKSKSIDAKRAKLGEFLKTQHLPIGYHAVFNIVTRNLLHPFEPKTLDVETRDKYAVSHRRLKRHRIKVVVLREITHHTAGEAVAGAGRVDDFLRRKRRHDVRLMLAKEHRAVLALFND